MSEKKTRVLIAKPDLDGHDRGAKVVALALRDAGMEVIYSGLHQSIDQILNTAMQESVDVVGLSIMTGGHLPICRRLFKRMQAMDMEDVHVVVGGVIPKQDIPALKELGVEAVFPGGTPFDEIAETIKSMERIDD
ncbi:MAG: methylmalonyl-CoA mutase [Deltaproteobacteria bacterium]|nr:MAG: methylmalonyl-CoA mutase [Deltaproteobacteria bacterium]